MQNNTTNVKRGLHSAVIGIKFKMSVIMILKNARHFKMIGIV